MGIFDTDGKTILMIFIGLIIATALIAPIADRVFAGTNTITIVNFTVTAPAVNATVDLQGRDLVSTTAVLNASNITDPKTINGTNLITGTSSTTGLRTVQLTVNDTGSAFAEQSLNVSYVANPDGYLGDVSSRSVLILVTLFAALGALIFVVVMLFKGSLGDIIRNNVIRGSK